MAFKCALSFDLIGKSFPVSRTNDDDTREIKTTKKKHTQPSLTDTIVKIKLTNNQII